MFSKQKHFVFSLVFLSTVLLFVTLNNIFLTISYKRQMDDEFQDMTTYLNSLRTPEWFDVLEREIKFGEKITTGLVNIDDRMTNEIQRKAKTMRVHFEHVGKQIRWPDLFPPWIDESLNENKCPNIPMPRLEDYQELDVIVANVSHGKDCESRDVARLQVNLVVANLLISARRKKDVFVVFLGSCEPTWEIFRCEDLLWKDNNAWIYKPELSRIEQKVFMPVGTCQNVPPNFQLGEQVYWKSHYNKTTRSKSKYKVPQRKPREAYVSILHSSEDYVCGAITLAHSIIQSNSTKDLVLLVDDHISTNSLEGLQAAGWKIKHIERIRSVHAKKKAYNRWNYSKLRIWELEEYNKVMFIDSDLIVRRNLDDFFMYPQLAAGSNYEKHFFNSGLMLIEPSMCTFKTLMNKISVVKSYNGGDQGFLNEMFTWWHRLPAKLIFLKVFLKPEDSMRQVPDDIYTIHYMGQKPWKCRKHYDCNWGWPDFRPYASNSAHSKWLDVYYAMPKKLRKYCPLAPQKDLRLVHDEGATLQNTSFLTS